ncbi:hypothetical protein CQ12_13905 [Bradyrhizobium jicamae]|uniref:Uncharacterized protein n=1 Tax=Bradyrhizobium jicamae TaxID=280332 RepID=A0A0R3LP12_9BRAD|nr:hypothetical protein [Bradyrhizobium jicamae]KRR09576.1 hypothetical protein CQ12_13905 [Bradyrhizobium jicamae]
MDWSTLQEAAAIVRAAGAENPAETITRAVSAAQLVLGAFPTPGRTPPVIRIRVILPQRKLDTKMMDWLHAPVLDFEKSEILCRGFALESWEYFHPRNHPARIAIWRADLIRRWPPINHGKSTGLDPLAAPRGGRQRTGAPEQYDWDEIEQFIRREFSKRGDFTRRENRVEGWRSQNDLIGLIKDHLEGLNEPIPGETRFKEKVGEMLQKLRSELATDH